MRRRLLLSNLLAAALALVLLGLPLSVAVSSLLTRSAFDRLQGEVEQAQVVLDRNARTTADAGAILTLLAQRSGHRFTLLDRSAVVVVDTGPNPAPPGATATSPDLDEAMRTDSAGFHRGDEQLAVALPVAIDRARLLLRVAAPAADLRREVRRAWAAIAGLGLTALGGAALVAVYQGRRIAAPLEALAESARRLGHGDFSARAPRSGVPETDDVAAALDTTADRLGTLVARSRSFGADASHQLRTPLTALRLDIEALEATGADPELIAAAMAETDRLESTIDELLTLAEAPRSTELVDLARLARARLDAWQSLARAQGRQVVFDGGSVSPVQARAAALGQCLQVLLDNALVHGDGTITVSVDDVAGGVRLCVSDEGPGFPPRQGPPRADGRTGRGLALARSLVEAEGGRLQIGQPREGAIVCLLLPAASGGAPLD
ncbi:MAG TPA: HAMP domain-containing sensor histidine kinase [Egibacteraceae bacterium]|nr:HAMP domain-containing sensor histidine kinase [Egibacteraceae bacterium]